jgi:hypothetical protein
MSSLWWSESVRGDHLSVLQRCPSMDRTVSCLRLSSTTSGQLPPGNVSNNFVGIFRGNRPSGRWRLPRRDRNRSVGGSERSPPRRPSVQSSVCPEPSLPTGTRPERRHGRRRRGVACRGVDYGNRWIRAAKAGSRVREPGILESSRWPARPDAVRGSREVCGSSRRRRGQVNSEQPTLHPPGCCGYCAYPAWASPGEGPKLVSDSG